MRALGILSLALAGCFDGPTGAPHTWPPPLGLDVEAVTSGDLDNDGAPEVIVYSAGTSHQAGMYLLRGGVDIAPGSGSPVRLFSTYAARPFARPVAAAQLTAAGVPRVFAGYSEKGGNFQVAALDADLADVNLFDIDTSIGGASAVFWIRPVVFPGNMPRVALSNTLAIRHMALDGSDLQDVPPPSGATWQLAQLAMSYPQGVEQVMVVATTTDIWRSPMPSATVSDFSWTQIRTGNAWIGQTTADLDGDGRDEILGFDLGAHEVNAIDPTIAGPSAISTGTTFADTEVTIVAGLNLTANPGPDILVVQAGPMATNFSLLEDVGYANKTLTATMAHGLGVSAGPHARVAVISAGLGAPNAVIAFGTDGAVTCVLGPC